jgi:hypothetical protein
MNKKKNILIAGPILPPAGGISIHIYRLEQLLKDEFEFSFIDEASTIKKNVFNIRSLNLYSYIKLVSQSDLFFIHSGNKYFKKLHILTGKLFRKKIIITLHGYGNERSPFFRKLDSFYFNLSDKIILVNNQIAPKLNLKPGKCEVKHAFLPPVMDKESPLPAYISEKIEIAKKENKTIICGNASRLNTFNNQDLYGLDMCIEVSKKLTENNQLHLFVFIVTSLNEGKDKFEAAEKYINDNDMQGQFMLLNQEISFVNLVSESDIVLRPTNTDGDALSIREGLFLGKTVVASDVVSRPEGTVLFKTRDKQDLFEKMTLAIQDNRLKKNSQVSNLINEDKHYYSNLFNEVMNRN